MAEQTFEKSIKELETIVAKLEDNECPLDKATELYEKGNELAKFCNEKLKQAEQKITVIENGEEA